MANFGVIRQGKFTSDGNSKILNIRSDFDWIRVYNLTQLTQAAADKAVEFYWQSGMDSGAGIKWTKLGSVANDPLTLGALTAGTGFTPIDQSNKSSWVSTAQATTGISNATSPVVSTAATNVSVGDVVILSQTSAQRGTANASSMLGIPWQIGAVNSGVSFTLGATLSQAPGAGIAAAAGSFRLLNPQSAYLPALRYIVQVDVSTPTAPVVYTSMKHGYSNGDVVTFYVSSSLNGMVEANQLSAKVTDATTNEYYFTCDLDTTGFTAFAFPLAADVAAAGNAYTPAHVVPAGMDSAKAIALSADLLADAVYNQEIIGVKLAGGADLPAGAANDVMYWVAGKSFSDLQE